MSSIEVVDSVDGLDIQGSVYENEESNDKIPENIEKKRSLGREEIDVPIESNVDTN